MDMEIDIKRIIAALKALPIVAKLALVVILADLVLVIVAQTFFEGIVATQENKVAMLTKRARNLKQQINTQRADIARLPELRRLYDHAMAEGLVGTKDRVKMLQTTQDIAARYHLTDLHYKFDVDEYEDVKGGAYQLASSNVNLDGKAVLDTDMMAFWQETLVALPAHFEVVEATLQRERDFSPEELSDLRTGRPAAMVSGELVFRWTSMFPTEKKGK